MQKSRTSGRRGNVLLTTVIVLPALIALASLGVDFGRVQIAKSQLQHAADAAARAGAAGLRFGESHGRSQAVDWAALNAADGSSVSLSTADVQIGRWNGSAVVAASDTRLNAVRVNAGRDAARGNAVPLVFGAIIGMSACDVSTTAVARVNAWGGFGLIGLDWADFNADISTDSYVSTLGTYPSTAGSNGHVASNGWIKLNSVVDVDRDVHMHPGQSLDVNGATYGNRRALQSSIVIPTPTAPGSYSNSGVFPAACASGGALNVNSQSCTLSGGTYVFSTLRVNSGTLNVTGETVIYVNGDVEFNSSTISVLGNLPENLTIRVTAPGLVKINSCPAVWADIVAPLANVELNSHAAQECHYYGRLWGKTLKVNSNVSLHADESLPLVSGASSPSGSAVNISLVR